MVWQEGVKRWRIFRVILGGEWKKLEERERLRQKVEKVERENDKDGHL